MALTREPVMPTSFVLRVLLFPEGDRWIAQGVEYDVVAQGRTPEDTKAAFERTFIARIIFDLEHGRPPLAGVDKAPPQYWAIVDRLTEHQETLNTPERIGVPDQLHMGVSVPPAFMIPIIQDNHAHS